MASNKPRATILTANDRFVRQDIALNLLQDFLSYKTPHSDNIHPQQNDFFLLKEIVQEEAFRAYNLTESELVQAIHADPRLRFSIRDDRVRFKPAELNKERSVQISKKLAWILRHGAERVNLSYLEGGWLYLDDVLQVQNFQSISEEEVEEVIKENNKQRFEMRVDPDSGRKQIRAVQGHSVEIKDLALKQITDANEFPSVVHGTYYRAWGAIKESGLCRMQRTHIHFAPGESIDDGVVSGMRSSAEVLVFIDLEKAIRDGYQFFLSLNNVILCPGNSEGFLPAAYFKQVIDRKTRASLI